MARLKTESAGHGPDALHALRLCLGNRRRDLVQLLATEQAAFAAVRIQGRHRNPRIRQTPHCKGLRHQTEFVEAHSAGLQSEPLR